jgi:transcriptional regulator with XRE-family HTH domain
MMPRRINSRATSTLDAQIGLRMRAIRVDQGISQNALAKRLGLTFQQAQKYERGVNRLSLSRAVVVARTLETSVNQLIGAPMATARSPSPRSMRRPTSWRSR